MLLYLTHGGCLAATSTGKIVALGESESMLLRIFRSESGRNDEALSLTIASWFRPIDLVIDVHGRSKPL